MSNIRHVMYDLETLGTVPGCVPLSIGAVEFDPATLQLGKEFYIVINRRSCEDLFLTTSQATLDWWSRQNGEARKVLEESANKKASVPLKLALEKFNAYLAGLASVNNLRIYGNGASFDNAIMACAYDAAKVKPAYGSYVDRCYRQLKNLDELFGERFKAAKATRGGTYHNALDDAKTQAVHLMEIIAQIRAL